uniref:Uncharacterized protein n=1 Tax=Peronospora matthiolae TaxID=2874970 RepID=A0AAV1V5A5_9STRA
MERQSVLQALLTTPPSRLREAPPMDWKRGHESSSEQVETWNADVSHKHNTTDFKRGRAEPIPMLMLANDERWDRIDRDD